MRSSTAGTLDTRGKCPATYLFEVIVACRFVILMPLTSKVSASVTSAVSRRIAASPVGSRSSGDVGAPSSCGADVSILSRTVHVDAEPTGLPGSAGSHGNPDAALERAAAATIPIAAVCVRIAATLKDLPDPDGCGVLGSGITKTLIDQYRYRIFLICLKDLRRAPAANGRHVGEELCDGIPLQTTRHENQPGSLVAVWPVLKLDRGMEHVLHHVDDHRPSTFFDRQKTFDAQKIGSTQ